MKAIKYLLFLFFISTFLFACNTKEQAKQSLNENTKAYFSIKDGSRYTFTNVADSNVNMEYTTSGYFNNQSNPDIENSEVLGYDLNSSGQDMMTVRCETGGAQFKDRIALITKRNDVNYAGPIIFNINGYFSAIENSSDSVFQLSSYTINGIVFTDVLRITMKTNPIYAEICYAKNLGLIAKKEKGGPLMFVKKYNVVQ